MKTFGQLKSSESRLKEVINSCKNSEDFRSLVNEASEILLNRGDWAGTVVPMRFIVRRGEVTWPRYVNRVRRINHCRTPLTVGTIWYDFVDRENYLGWAGDRYYDWGGDEFGENRFRHGLGQGSLVSQGRVCTYNDVPCANPQTIRAIPRCPQDYGKKMRIFGLDGGNQPLRELTKGGQYQDGITITLKVPYGESAVNVSRIDAVEREQTQMNVGMFANDTVTGAQLDLAMYEPTETNPSYARDRLFAANHPKSCCDMTVVALVKLAHIPVKADSDYVLIPSTSALKKAIQSIKFGEAGDINLQESYLQSAINELNMNLNNELPLNQTSVDEGFMGEKFGMGFQNVI